MITKINNDAYMTACGIVVLAAGSYDANNQESIKEQILFVLNDASSQMDEPGIVYDETML